MKKFAFISRHVPTPKQVQIAADKGITLVHVGDVDAFDMSPAKWPSLSGFSGAVVVHPLLALQLCGRFDIGIFNNVNRAPVGSPPQFDTTDLVIVDIKGGPNA